LEGNRYIFSSNNSDGDGDSSEEEHLKVRKQETFLEREVQPGDTLQTLALQFNCPVSIIGFNWPVSINGRMFSKCLAQITSA